MASQPIYQFYSELLDYQPKIWRRFQVPGNITLARLGYIVMTLYEMKGNHLFQFTLPELYNHSLFDPSFSGQDDDADDEKMTVYTLNSDEEDHDFMDDMKTEDMTAAKMKNLFHGVAGEKLLMEYDFGDGWEVELTLESITKDPELPGNELPRVLDGKGFGIVEDCGGVDGLADVANAFKEKSGEAYLEYRAWLGVKNLNLERLDKKDMNIRLKKLPRIFQALYEKHEPLSQNSIDFLERAYKHKPKKKPKYIWVYTEKK